MKFFWIFLLLFILICLQTTLVSIPFVLGGILLLSVLYKEYWIFPVSFVAGILLDLVTFQTVGITSLFFTFVLGILFLYERKFEIQSMPFITMFTFLASLAYGYLFDEPYVIFASVALTGMLSGLFFFLARFPMKSTASRIHATYNVEDTQ